MARAAKEPSLEDGHVWLAEYNADAWSADMVCIARSRDKAQELCQEYENEYANGFNKVPETLVFKRLTYRREPVGWV